MEVNSVTAGISPSLWLGMQLAPDSPGDTDAAKPYTRKVMLLSVCAHSCPSEGGGKMENMKIRTNEKRMRCAEKKKKDS